MNKKRIFAIVVFIILGLFMYTFANPLNDETNDGKANESATSTNTNEPGTNSELLATETNTGRNNTRRVVNTNTNTIGATDTIIVNETPVSVDQTQPAIINPTDTKPTDDKPAVIPNPVDLTFDKINAVNELKAYESDYVYSDDTEYNKVIDEYTTKINESTTKNEIDSNLKDGKDKIEQLIKDDLAAYKQAAKDEITKHAESLNLKTDVTDIINEYFDDIDEASTKKAIDKIVEDAKNYLNGLKDQEIADAQKDAKKDINGYKTEDEKYIEEITTTKEEAIKEIEDTKDVDKIKEIVENTKDAIDKLIETTTFKVNFYDFNKVLIDSQDVVYTKSAKEPKINKEEKTFYGHVINEFVDWSVDFTEVKSALDVYANYKVAKATARVFIVKEESNNKTRLEKDDYEEIYNKAKINLNDDIVNAINAYTKGKEVIVTNDEKTIRDAVDETLPTLYKENKYKTVEFYVLKVTGDGIHVDGKINYDFESELADKKTAAKDYIGNLNTADEEYIDVISVIKSTGIEDVGNATTLEEIDEIVKKVEEDINTAISNKKYTVTFYGIKGKVKSQQTIDYKKSATIPEMTSKITEWNGSISLEFAGWDIEDISVLDEVTDNYEIKAKYNVLSATTKISILKEDLKDKKGNPITYSTNINDFNHPYNKPDVKEDTYFELTITDDIVKAVNNYTKDPIFVYVDDDSKIREVINGEPNVYNNNEYKVLQYYVLKLQGDRFHCDARVIYDRETELADAKTAAINEINNYKTVETNDISEVKDEKIKAIKAIEKMTSVEDVKNKVQPTKDAIDKIIANKTYDVTFVGKTSSQTVKVGYNKDAVAPTTKEFTNPVYRNVTYTLTGWDKEEELKNIKENKTITAKYDIEKVVATVFLIDEDNEDCNIPKDRSSNLAWGCYKNFKTIEIKATKEIKEAIANDKTATVFTSDEAIRAVDKNSSLPTKDGKYKTYEFYVMKFIEDSYAGFHIDGKMFYDKDAEALDNAKDELNKLIKKAEKTSTEGKTTESVDKLKQDISTAKAVVEKDNIDDINESIKDLSNINLVDIKVTKIYVTNNKYNYYDNEKFDLTVTYDDNNGKKNEPTTKYTVTDKDNTPNKKHTATVTYGGETETFDYEVYETKVTKISAVNHTQKYYKDQNANITVTATYNNGTSRNLESSEYRLNNFQTSSEATKRTATVVLISNNTIKDTFDYAVSKYTTKDEENRGMITDLYIKADFVKLHGEITFDNYNKEINVVSMHRVGNLFNITIELTSTSDDNKFTTSFDDMMVIRATNSDTFDQYIYVTYVIDNTKYVAKYREENHGKFKFVSFE